jgi:hypothetical protein
LIGWLVILTPETNTPPPPIKKKQTKNKSKKQKTKTKQYKTPPNFFITKSCIEYTSARLDPHKH